MKIIRLFAGLLLSFLGTASTAQNTSDSLTLDPAQREKWVQSASQQRTERNYKAAIEQLDSILLFNPSDAQILLFKGDLLLQYGKFGAAVRVYQKLLPLNYETTITKVNLSYALFMDHKPRKALHYAQQAWTGDPSDEIARINYFNALLWNLKTRQAGQFLDEQRPLFSPKQLMVLQARLHTASGAFQKGVERYDQLIRSYREKDFIKEYTEVLLGKKRVHHATDVLIENRSVFSDAEYLELEQRISAASRQQAGTEFSYFKDLSGNTRIDNIVFWQQAEGKKYQWGCRAGNSVLNSLPEDRSTVPFVAAELRIKLNNMWSSSTSLGVRRILATNGADFTALTGKQLFQYRPNDRRMLGLYVSSDILYFTSSLLQKNVRTNRLGYVTHIMLDGKTGIYSEGSASLLNDRNRRAEFFGSFYRLLRTEPTLKTGLNFSALHFSDNDVESYFAPNRFLSAELFADYVSALPQSSKFFVHFQGAAGLQAIERQGWEPAFRLLGETGYRSQFIEMVAIYRTSNVASATGTGYKYNWVTFRLTVKW